MNFDKDLRRRLSKNFVDKLQETAFPGLEVSETNVLDVGVIIDAVSRSFPAKSGLLHPTKSRLRGADHALVDPNHANLKNRVKIIVF
jgi:hypothetical protein